MNHLSKVTDVKFKRYKYQEECSNCHKWYSSKKVDKSWMVGRYFNFEPTNHDSISDMQWYKPTFRSDVFLNTTLTEKMAYLKGLYLNSGSLDALKVTFTIDESFGKSLATKELLIELGFENVNSIVQTFVPENGMILENRTTLTFIATDEILAKLKTEIQINKAIKDKR